MKSIEQLIADYARLVIQSGVNLYKGQSLMIKTGYDTYYFARVLAETAYDLGAALVQIDIDDPRITRKRTDVQSVEELAVVPDFARQMDYEMMVKDWAYVRIDNTEDRHWLAEANAERLSSLRSALSKSGTAYRNSRMRHEHPWCVICVPGPVWAKKSLVKKPP